MLRNVVTPGASSAAAICFTPEFFVAPATSTRPSSGPLARTRKRVMVTILGARRGQRSSSTRGPLLDERGDRLAHVVGAQADALLLGFDHAARRQPAAGPTPRPRASRPVPRAAAAPRSSPRARRLPARDRRRRRAGRTTRCGTTRRRRYARRSRSTLSPCSRRRRAEAAASRRGREGCRTCARAARPACLAANTRTSHASASCSPAPSA